jgi:hypothetical protein
MGIAALDNALRRGLGKAGEVIGTTFSVYRLGGTSGTPNGAANIIDPLNLINDNYFARIVHQKPPVVIETEEVYRLYYIGLCDTRQLKVGDVFVETGPELADTPDGRVYFLNDVQPFLPPVFTRVEIFGTITRPHGDGASEQPIQGYDGYQGESKFTEEIITLGDSLYSFATSGTPTVIPMGIQPAKRMGSQQDIKFPTATHRGLYMASCPLLPGVQIQPGDYLSDQNGSRYVIHVPHAQTVGNQGIQMLVESVFT